MNITKISIERPTLAVVVFSLLIFLGILSYTFLSYELVPKFTPPVITITTVYPGASPAEVESNVSIPIEDAVSSLQNIDLITSNSVENFSLIKLELNAGTDVNFALQEVERKLAGASSNLPENAEKPVLRRFDFDDLPVMRIAAFSSLDPYQFSKLVQNHIIPQLQQIEGIAQVDLLGAREQEIHINIDPNKLALNRVSILQVLQAIKQSNINVPVGAIEKNKQETFIRLLGKINDLDQLRNLIITTRLDRKIRIRNVAKVEIDERKQKVINRINGLTSIGIDIKKQGDANAVVISELVKDKIHELQQHYMEADLQFEIAQDSSEFTLAAANAVISDLALAVLLVALVMLLFLHSIRNSLIVLISIPTSIIATFIVMYLMDYTLNLLSLLGLSLAIGILVDDSIVVIENIYRHFEMKKGKAKAAFEGRMEIGFTAISITLIDVVVFLPIVFASGMVADLLRQFSVVIITSTLMSLFVSFTLVPLLASRFGKLERLKESTLAGKIVWRFERFIDDVIAKIALLLQWAFDHKTITLITAFLLLIASSSLIFFGFIGLEFTKSGDRSEFVIEIELPKGTPLEKTDKTTQFIEEYLQRIQDVESVFTTVGITSKGNIQLNTSNLAEISVRLIDKKQRNYASSELARIIKYELESQLPDVIVRPVGINIIGIRDDDAVLLTLTGNDIELLYKTADIAFDTLQNTPGAIEAITTLGESAKEIQILTDHERMASLGLNQAQIGMGLRVAYSGDRSSDINLQNDDYKLHIKFDENMKANPEGLVNLSFLNNEGHLIYLNQIATIKEGIGYNSLERTNRTPSVTIQSQVIGKPAGSVGNDLKNKIQQMDIPEGINYLFGGQTKRTQDGLKTMGIAFAISIMLVYFILVALYDSYHYPFVVLFSIPLAVIGALLALALTQQALSIFSILGLIMLVGLVGKNAILVVDFTNSLRENGKELKEALLEATRLRFRPILMTNITMVIGLLPIALAGGAGSEWKNGLAWALIGGLSSSMFLTLIIVPVVYYLFERGLERMGVKKREKVIIEH